MKTMTVALGTLVICAFARTLYAADPAAMKQEHDAWVNEHKQWAQEDQQWGQDHKG